MYMTGFLCTFWVALALLIIKVNGGSTPTTYDPNNKPFQGDIVISSRTRNGILKAQRWPNGVIPYEFRTQYAQDRVTMIEAAMRAIEASTCIKFVKRTNEQDYVYIESTSGGCFSNVGKAGGAQRLSLQDGIACMDHPKIVHELLHAVGLWHEHMRYDRDNYVTINLNNVREEYKSDFNMKLPNETSTYDVPYNYLSVMHYRAVTFSSNGDITIQPKDDSYTDIMGTVRYAHELDWEKVRRIYECKGTYTPAPTTAVPVVMCKDTISYCNQYESSKCKTQAFMRLSCRQYCGFCSSGQPICQDKRTDCRRFKKECKSQAWMEESCEKTCGFC